MGSFAQALCLKVKLFHFGPITSKFTKNLINLTQPHRIFNFQSDPEFLASELTCILQRQVLQFDLPVLCFQMKYWNSRLTGSLIVLDGIWAFDFQIAI